MPNNLDLSAPAFHRSQSLVELRSQSDASDADKFLTVYRQNPQKRRSNSLSSSENITRAFELPSSRKIPPEIRNEITSYDYHDLPLRIAESNILDALPNGLGVRSERQTIPQNSDLGRLVKDNRTPSALKKSLLHEEEVESSASSGILSEFYIPHLPSKISCSYAELNKNADLCLKLLQQVNPNPNSHAKSVINKIKELVKPGLTFEESQRSMFRHEMEAQNQMQQSTMIDAFDRALRRANEQANDRLWQQMSRLAQDRF